MVENYKRYCKFNQILHLNLVTVLLDPEKVMDNMIAARDGMAFDTKERTYSLAEQCPDCVGRGRVQCRQCAGTGKAPGASAPGACQSCGGSGRKDCRRCGATGTITRICSITPIASAERSFTTDLAVDPGSFNRCLNRGSAAFAASHLKFELVKREESQDSTYVLLTYRASGHVTKSVISVGRRKYEISGFGDPVFAFDLPIIFDDLFLKYRKKLIRIDEKHRYVARRPREARLARILSSFIREYPSMWKVVLVATCEKDDDSRYDAAKAYFDRQVNYCITEQLASAICSGIVRTMHRLSPDKCKTAWALAFIPLALCAFGSMERLFEDSLNVHALKAALGALLCLLAIAASLVPIWWILKPFDHLRKLMVIPEVRNSNKPLRRFHRVFGGGLSLLALMGILCGSLASYCVVPGASACKEGVAALCSKAISLVEGKTGGEPQADAAQGQDPKAGGNP